MKEEIRTESQEPIVMIKFPLCLLSMGLCEEEKIKHIICFGLKDKNIPSSRYYLSHGSDKLLVDSLHVDEPLICNKYERAKTYYHQYLAIIQKKEDAWVQVNTTLCVNTMNGEFSYDLFALICAISSVVGQNNPYGTTTNDIIKLRMAGVKSNSELNTLKACPIIEWETGDILSILENPFISYYPMKISRLRNKASKMGFFTHHYSKKLDNDRTYYSTRFKDEILLVGEIYNQEKLIQQSEEIKNKIIRGKEEEIVFIRQQRRRKKNSQVFNSEYNSYNHEDNSACF